MVRKLLLMISFFVVISCNEKFLFVKQPFIGNSLKTNGYYYNLIEGVETNYSDLYFLYRDGTFYKGGSGSFEKNEKMINVERIDTLIYKSILSNSITNWGVFRVSSNQIEYDMRYPRIDAPVYRRKGIIINDSTFIIKSVSKPNGKEVRLENVVYHFRPFHPKPDSTNKFIK